MKYTWVKNVDCKQYFLVDCCGVCVCSIQTDDLSPVVEMDSAKQPIVFLSLNGPMFGTGNYMDVVGLESAVNMAERSLRDTALCPEIVRHPDLDFDLPDSLVH